MVKRLPRINVEVDLADYADEISDLDDSEEDFIAIRDALETARRHLSAPTPRPLDALMEIERALETTASALR